MEFVVICALQYGGWFFSDHRNEYYMTRSTIRCEELAREKNAGLTKVIVFTPQMAVQLQALCGSKLEDCKKD